MSIKTWKAAYYPKPANKTTEEEALDHSIRKWEGLRKKDLKKHDGDHIRLQIHFKDGSVRIDASTCSLCHHYFWTEGTDVACVACPIFRANGRTCSDEYSKAASFDLKITPMLRLLRKTKKLTK